MSDFDHNPEDPLISDRDAFLKSIEANPEDMAYRLIFADWLDEHGEHDEADRQRKYPEAKKWIEDAREQHNKQAGRYSKVTFDQFIAFGHAVSQIQAVEVAINDDALEDIPNAIADKIPDFWKAWAVVTGLPLPEKIEEKCYYYPGYYCCATDNSPLTHVAGPKTEEFLRIEEREAQERLDLESFEE